MTKEMVGLYVDVLKWQCRVNSIGPGIKGMFVWLSGRQRNFQWYWWI